MKLVLVAAAAVATAALATLAAWGSLAAYDIEGEPGYTVELGMFRYWVDGRSIAGTTTCSVNENDDVWASVGSVDVSGARLGPYNSSDCATGCASQDSDVPWVLAANYIHIHDANDDLDNNMWVAPLNASLAADAPSLECCAGQTCPDDPSCQAIWVRASDVVGHSMVDDVLAHLPEGLVSTRTARCEGMCNYTYVGGYMTVVAAWLVVGMAMALIAWPEQGGHARNVLVVSTVLSGALYISTMITALVALTDSCYQVGGVHLSFDTMTPIGVLFAVGALAAIATPMVAIMTMDHGDTPSSGGVKLLA